VYRHVHAYLLVFQDTLHVHVQDLALRRMSLYVLQNGRLALVANLDREDARVERLVIELVEDLVVIEYQRPGGTPASIHDCRNFSVATQAAARTLPLVFTELCNQAEFLFHCDSPTLYLVDFRRCFRRLLRFPAATSRKPGAHVSAIAGFQPEGRGENRRTGGL
jgi:hypothetical protein